MGGGQQGARADFSAWRRCDAPFVPRGELKGPDNSAARWCSLRHTLARKRVKRRHRGQLDILLTDIVMPGLRGPELARRVAKVHPEAQIVYMSGYAEGFPEAQLPAAFDVFAETFSFCNAPGTA